jgi:polygalacturonase
VINGTTGRNTWVPGAASNQSYLVLRDATAAGDAIDELLCKPPSLSSAPALSAPRNSQQNFNVAAFGAIGDGRVTFDTAAVRAAAAALKHARGGRLPFPSLASKTRTAYLTGAFNLSSNCEFFIEANVTILGSPCGQDWPLIQPLQWYGGGSDDRNARPCRNGSLMHQALQEWQLDAPGPA